jgi:hypothetical protein
VPFGHPKFYGNQNNIQLPLPLTIKIIYFGNFGHHTTINNKTMVKYDTLWHGFNVFLGDISYSLTKKLGKFNNFFGFKCEFNQISYILVIFWQTFDTKKILKKK